MSEFSVLECINKLCEVHLGPIERAHRVQPAISRTNASKRLRKKAYDALFSALPQRPGQNENYPWSSPEVEGVLTEVDRLRAQRRHVDADRLEELLDSLTGDDYRYLRLLVALKGSGNKAALPVFGEGVFGSVTTLTGKVGASVVKKSRWISSAPLCYEEPDISSYSSRCFMHYPSEIFETLFAPVEMKNERDLNTVFTMAPGKGLGAGGFFTQKFLLDDCHEDKTHSSLFGGLVQGKAEDVNSFFSIPEICQSQSIRIPQFKTKKSISSTQLSDESGVESGSASMSSSVMTLPDQPEHDPWFWVNALKAPRSYHYTWEWTGYAPGPTEKPHLTEAGSAVFDLLIAHRHRVLTILSPPEASTLFVLKPVNPKTLVKDTLLMLTGVPSSNFLYDPVSMSFQVRSGLHISGISPEILLDFLTDFTDCGAYCRRLAKFSEAPILNSFYTSGLVFQAFTVAVRKALTQFTAAVLNTPLTLGLLQLQVYLHHAMEQIKYLAKLCCCLEGPPKLPFDGEGRGVQGQLDFPIGMNLLSYLYNESEIAMNSSCYPLLLSILQITCAPFVLFIRDWVFYGVLRDSYEEFMIKVDTSCIIKRDESYWSSAYILDTLAAVPKFLEGLVEDIVTCGKSINLLKVCSPQHFLCNLSEHGIPSLYITYSKSTLQAMEQDCQMYVGRMRQISQQGMDDRAEMMRKAEVERAELQQTARRMADEEIARLQGIIDNRRKKSQDKKRAEFSRLKQQMEKDLSRRAGEKQAEKEEDAKLMARLAREEDALTEEEIELERQAREELVQYYTSLGEEAAHRERRALWKIQRARLSMRREEFLQRDVQQWSWELGTLQTFVEKKETAFGSGQGEGDGALNMVPPNSESGVDSPDYAVDLPRWVQRYGGGDGSVTIETSGEEEVTLPAWAARELPPVFDEEEEDASSDGVKTLKSGVQLPSWVLREADGENENSPRVVDDTSEEGADSDIENEAGNEEKQDILSEGKDAEANVVSRSKSEEKDSNQESKELNSHLRLRGVQIGGSPLPKPHIKTSSITHHSIETEEMETKPNTRLVHGKHASCESSDREANKPQIKLVSNVSVSNQSEEAETRAAIKTSNLMSATQESSPGDENSKFRVKFVDGVEVNRQSTLEREVIPKRGKHKDQPNVCTESVPQMWVIKKPSLFGHASQLSGSEYVLTVPKLKRQASRHASTESTFKDFSIKPRIRMSKAMSATKNSHEFGSGDDQRNPSSKTHIKMIEGRGSSVESQRVDENELARRKFLARNSSGHASDSTVQHLLYGDFRSSRWTMQVAEEEESTDGPAPKITLTPGLPYEANCFQSEFKCFDEDLRVDLMADVLVADLGHDLADSDVASEEDVEAYKYTPLSVLLARSVTAPIKAQISIVNSAVVNYFTSDLRIDDHFIAIRRYLLMADGDFAEILANILFEKLSTNPLPFEIFNPVFLNRALTKAVRSSIYSDDEHMKNLTFALNHMPAVLMPNAPNSLSCLELRYTVQWPLNVILTRGCMQKYCRIFRFLLQIKRVVWTLKDVWYRLKRDALMVCGAANCAQFRHLQLHRQEMEHFVKAMQGYITSQVIHVSWQEFQTELAQPIAGLDQLQARHQRYVDRAIAKCLLNKKAAKVMKVIQDIFSLILKFRSQLVSVHWQTSGGEVVHPNFEAISHTHKSFHVYSFFLFKVVNRLSQKGYQPHLQELLLQLNFNDFYKEAAS